MEEKIIEIKNRAKKIISERNIETLSDEKELLEKLNDIVQHEGGNGQYDEKILKNIEIYLLSKEKMQCARKDLEFLNNLSRELKEQGIRRTDVSNPPLFKITNSVGHDIYFLTRKSLEEYIKYNEKDNHKIIEIPDTSSEELAQLLEIIKRNF